MDVDRSSGIDLLADRRQDALHLLTLARQAHVLDGVANVLDLDPAFGGEGPQQSVVLRQRLILFGEVDERPDAGIEELRQPLEVCLLVRRCGYSPARSMPSMSQ